MLRVAIVAVVASLAAASHFRYASMAWEKGEGNTVNFLVETAWRRSYDGNYEKYHKGSSTYLGGTGTGDDGYPVNGDEIEINGVEWPVLDAGDGTQAYLTMTVSAYSKSEDWFFGEAIISHTYSTPSNQGEDWVASFTGCCRLSNLINNKNTAWNVEAHVNLMTEEYSAHSKSLPIITVSSYGGNFYMPATNSNNELNNLEWTAELGAGELPDGFSVGADGLVSFAPTGADPFHTGLYNAGVVVHSGRATTPVDFIIRVANTAGDSSFVGYTLPSLGSSASAYPTAETCFVGFACDFTVTTDAATGGFTWGVLPDGASLGIEKEGTSQDFHWVPCNGQQGDHIVCFESVTADGLASTQHCVHYHVVSDPAPEFTGDHSNTLYAYIGGLTDYSLVVTDGNCADSVTIVTDGSHPVCRDADSAWPAGASLGEQSAVPSEGDDCDSVQASLLWNPSWDQGGWRGTICAAGIDTAGGCNGAGVAQKTSQCINVEVVRCEYVIQYEQQLQEIAAIYATDWITLWHHNHALKHPDFEMYHAQHVYTGHVLRVNIRDTLYDIAERYGTSVKWLHYMNADLCLDDSIDIDQDLCVLSNACEGATKTPYGHSTSSDGYWYSAAKDAYHREGAYEEAGVQHTYPKGHHGPDYSADGARY